MPTRDDSGVNFCAMNLKQTQFLEAGCMRGSTSIGGNCSGGQRLVLADGARCAGFFALLMATAIAAGMIVSPLHAQEPPRPSGPQERAVRTMNAQGNVSDAATYQDCYRYYAYQIASVGQTIDGKPKTIDNADKNAKKFQNGLRDAKEGSAAQTALQGYILDWMLEIARGSYSDIDEVTTQGRAMAMMTIAHLDESGSPGKPLAATLPVLLEAVDGAAFNNDGVRAVAIFGIVRHAESGVADAQADAVFEKMAQLATQLQPPQGRDEDVHTFFRCRAVDALGTLGVTEKVPSLSELTKVLSATLAAPGSRGVELRCAAASAISRQNWADKKDSDVKEIGFQLGNLAITVTGVASSADELKSRLHSIDLALTGGDGDEDGGIIAGAEGESKEYLDELKKQFLTLYDAVFSPVAPGSEIQAAKGEAAKLTEWLIQNPIAEAPVETVPENRPAAPAAAAPAAEQTPTEETPAAEVTPAEETPAEATAG